MNHTKNLNIPLNIHIGLPKCGSSSIQTFLNDLDPSNYLGKFPHEPRSPNPNPYRNAHIKSFFRETILYEHELLLDESLISESLKELLLPFYTDKLPLLVSDEELSGFCFWNNQYSRAPDMLSILQRLRRFFNPLKVLLVFREPHKFLRSYYHQLIRMGYDVAYPVFIESMLVKRRELIQFFYLDRLIEKAQQLDIEIVLLPLEGLRAQPERFLSVISDFFGYPCPALPQINQTPGQKKVFEKFLKNMNSIHNLGVFTPYYQKMKTKDWFEAQKKSGSVDFYALSVSTSKSLEQLVLQSNHAMQNTLDWDLAALGYRL